MPRFGPIARRELVAYLKRLGFDGPYPGGRHEFLVKGQIRIAIPNPHHGEIDRDLLAKLLREAGIDRQDWEKL